jgi:RNA polymerase sigma factor (sigma-70 family)
METFDTRRSLLIRLRDGADGEGQEQAAAWEEFVRIYSPQVLRWCRRYGLQDTDAGDLCQDVLVRFWKQSAKFEYDPSKRFRGYMRQILTSALSGWSAARKPDAPSAGTGGDALLDSVPAREDLIQRIESAYDTELLAVAIADVKTRVKPHTWRAFEIVAMERKPGSEAAKELGITADSVYAARRNVQKMLQETVARLEGADREE